jgi:hypothetical protein
MLSTSLSPNYIYPGYSTAAPEEAVSSTNSLADLTTYLSQQADARRATIRQMVCPRLLIKSRRRATAKRDIALFTATRMDRAR